MIGQISWNYRYLWWEKKLRGVYGEFRNEIIVQIFWGFGIKLCYLQWRIIYYFKKLVISMLLGIGIDGVFDSEILSDYEVKIVQRNWVYRVIKL